MALKKKNYVKDKYSKHNINRLKEIIAEISSEYNELYDEITITSKKLSKLREEHHNLNIELSMAKRSLVVKKKSAKKWEN